MLSYCISLNKEYIYIRVLKTNSSYIILLHLYYISIFGKIIVKDYNMHSYIISLSF
jgi:hypothetical protein